MSDLVVSADGRWVATASWDQTARIWDLQSENPAASVRVLRGHRSTLSSLAISSDSRFLVTASVDKTARVYDLTAENPNATSLVLRGHKGFVDWVSVTDDNRWVVTASEEAVRFWDLNIEMLIDRGRRLAGRDLTQAEKEQYSLDGLKSN